MDGLLHTEQYLCFTIKPECRFKVLIVSYPLKTLFFICSEAFRLHPKVGEGEGSRERGREGGGVLAWTFP